ncbi:hypothetical protein Tco_0755488 [Tanacetum coccineum]
MRDVNPIRTLGDYSKTSHEGYRNTIELLVGNNVVYLFIRTIRSSARRMLIHGEFVTEIPNQNTQGFLKTSGSVTTWEDLTNLSLLNSFRGMDRKKTPQRFILMCQLHHGESLSEAWKSFKDLPLKVSHQWHPFPWAPNGPHDTQYCMEYHEQAFVEYASSRIDKVGGKWYTFKPEQNNLGDTYNPSWKSHPNLRWRQPQNSLNNFSNPPNQFQPNGSIPNRSFNNNPRIFNNQSNPEGLVSNFMAYQSVRLSKFEANFKQQESEMTNKIDIVLKAITDRLAGALLSDTVKNPKLNVNTTTLVLSARSYPTKDPQCSTHIHSSNNVVTIHPNQQSNFYDNKPAESEEKKKDSLKNTNTNPSASPDPSV